jgi:hypothetical protein
MTVLMAEYASAGSLVSKYFAEDAHVFLLLNLYNQGGQQGV